MNPSPRRVEPVVVAALALLFYVATGAREVLWGDPTKLTLAVHRFEITLAQWSHLGGLVWSRPFAALPLEPYAWRLHLSSALASALALGVLHAILTTRVSARAARVGTAAVLVAHTYWYVSAMMESYPVALLVIAIGTYLFVVSKRPVAGAFVLGLGGLVHHLTLFPLPAYLIVLFLQPGERKRAVLAGVAAVLGLVVPSLVVALFSSAGGDTEIDSVFERYVSVSYVVKNVPLLLLFLVYNFAGLAVVLLAVGLWRLPGTQKLGALLLVAVHYGIALVWLPQRSFLIPLPVYFAAAYPIALASESLLAKRPRLGGALLASVLALPVATYVVAPTFYGFLRAQFAVRDVALRDESRYFVRPWKAGEVSARLYIERVEKATPEGAVLVGDFTTLTPLWYAQDIEGWRPDVTLYTVDHVEEREVEERLGGWLDEGRRVFFVDDQVFKVPAAIDRLGTRERVDALSAMTELRR